jgi:hypothetical protein
LTLSVPDEGYSNLLTLSIPDEGYSNLLTLSIPDEGYSKVERLESQIIFKVLGAIKLKGLIRRAKISIRLL